MSYPLPRTGVLTDSAEIGRRLAEHDEMLGTLRVLLSILGRIRCGLSLDMDDIEAIKAAKKLADRAGQGR